MFDCGIAIEPKSRKVSSFKLVAAAKAEDRNLQREHDLKARGYTYGLIGSIVLLISGIIFYAIYSGNKDIAMEIIKAIVYLAGGGLGGYGAAKVGESKSSSNDIPKE